MNFLLAQGETEVKPTDGGISGGLFKVFWGWGVKWLELANIVTTSNSKQALICRFDHCTAKLEAEGKLHPSIFPLLHN